MFQIQHPIRNLPSLQDGVSLIIILAVGMSSIMENVVANVISKVYNNHNGAE